ncbi:Lipid II:glycine glycyltransferase (Peptidoglycan interpeptide bridge formation enzyme) [Peptostreptococcaceae bacterium pGA-8]|nr:Lipid II:glycine glycyltransferase (Peptidoglycan interpeptide bridge formation enzyme) [Peptostreptococcaceae bacterium pGA-8]
MSNFYIKEASPEEFFQVENDFEVVNFLQSGEFCQVQLNRDVPRNNQCLLFYRDSQIVGGCVVHYQRRYKFFLEAVINHGPLINYAENSKDSNFWSGLLSALKEYFKSKNVANLVIAPYLSYRKRNESLEIVVDEENPEIIQAFQSSHFKHLGVTNDIIPVANQMFIKSIEGISTEDELFETIDAKTRRSINKNLEYNIRIQELGLEEIDKFYEIETATCIRKGFDIQEFSYFYNMKKYFGDKAHFLLATMDFDEYTSRLKCRLEDFDKEIEKYEAMEQRAKIQRKVKTLKSDRNDFFNKLNRTLALNDTGEQIIPLSAILCIETRDEIIYFAGGSYEKFMRFGGTTSIIWLMLKKALKDKKKAFNFYGTMEVDDAKSSIGNFYFKSQFGGQLVNLIGRFQFTYSPLFKLIAKVKG